MTMRDDKRGNNDTKQLPIRQFLTGSRNVVFKKNRKKHPKHHQAFSF